MCSICFVQDKVESTYTPNNLKSWTRSIAHVRLSNWRPAGRIRPATPCNPARDYPPENVVHRSVKLTIIRRTKPVMSSVICKYSTTAVGKHQSFDFNYSIFDQCVQLCNLDCKIVSFCTALVVRRVADDNTCTYLLLTITSLLTSLPLCAL